MAAQQQLEVFNNVYAQLNAEQKKAVDAIEGPVMVIAGPGTGKTQILSARIGKILLETDTQPDNILCLTYTDAGTLAMRKRLMKFIGTEAYKVHIHTFHSFCNEIIQTNLSYFDKNALDPLSELEKSAFLKQLIDGFKENNPLKRYRGDVYTDAGKIFAVFQTIKKEGFVPNDMLLAIDAYITNLPFREEYIYKKASGNNKKGDVKQNAVNEEIEKMQKLKAAIEAYESFQTIMQKQNRYDFDDMILWVIKAFTTHENLLRKYQEQYLYILVDEFQDTSGTQNKLVELLLNYWDVPNVFVVGDDDQSIYRFQGANVENMLNFAQKYASHLQRIVLTNNYRSTQPILDISKSVIEKNEQRLIKQIQGLSKNLVASNTNINQLTHLPKVLAYNSQHEEMIGVCQQVQHLIQNGVSPAKIAIIYKEHKYAETLANYLNKLKVPFYAKKSEDVLTQPFCVKLIKILQYLYHEHDVSFGGEELLFYILHYDFWQIPAIEVAKLASEASARSKDKKTIRQLLTEKQVNVQKDLFSPAVNNQLKNASEQLEALIALVPNTSLQQLFEAVIQHCGIVPYVMEHPEKYWLLKQLTAFFNFIKEETHKQPLLTLPELIDNLQLMQQNGIAIPIVQVNGTEKGVNLLTAHGSKGLEYTHVFFVGCNSDTWEKKVKNNQQFKFPDTLLNNTNKQADEEETRRLFYVATTRAETHLNISYGLQDDKGRGKEPSMFVAEIVAEHNIEIEKVALDESVIFNFSILQLKPTKPEIDQKEQEFLQPILSNFTLNVTALNNYLECPLKFYYQNLIRIPSSKSESLTFGSAVHDALDKLFKKMLETPSPKQFPSVDVLLQDFNYYMQRNRETFTETQYKRRLEYGAKVLPDYYNKYIAEWNKIVAVERTIATVVNNVPIKGKIDKLEFDGKNINVVDYKTGDYENAKIKKVFNTPNEKNIHGGNYWRQAVFYKLLIDNYEQKDWQVISTEFDFVEPDKKGLYQKEKIVITPQDLTTVKQQITEVWHKIQNRDFYIGCGKAECQFCNFVKDSKIAIQLHDVAEEA